MERIAWCAVVKCRSRIVAGFSFFLCHESLSFLAQSLTKKRKCSRPRLAVSRARETSLRPDKSTKRAAVRALCPIVPPRGLGHEYFACRRKQNFSTPAHGRACWRDIVPPFDSSTQGTQVSCSGEFGTFVCVP